MEIRECYEMMQGDYDDALSRLMKDERIKKYLLKFAAANDYEALVSAVDAEEWEEAFRLSHTLKGVALNLGITQFGQSSSDLCEMLRGGGQPTGDPRAALERITRDYETTMAAIAALD